MVFDIIVVVLVMKVKIIGRKLFLLVIIEGVVIDKMEDYILQEVVFVYNGMIKIV